MTQVFELYMISRSANDRCFSVEVLNFDRYLCNATPTLCSLDDFAETSKNEVAP